MTPTGSGAGMSRPFLRRIAHIPIILLALVAVLLESIGAGGRLRLVKVM